MNYKIEDINKIIENSILESQDGVEFLNKVLRHFMIEVPLTNIEVKEVSRLVGLPYLRGRVYFDHSFKNSYGQEINYDSLKLLEAEIIGYLGNGEVAYRFNYEKLKKSYKFFNADNDVICYVLEKVRNYIEIDVEDYDGHPFGAIHCIFEKDNSPSQEWNQKIKIKNEIEKKRLEENYKKFQEEEEKRKRIEEEKAEKERQEFQNKIKTLKETNSPIFQIWDRNEIIFEIRYNDVIKNNYNIEVPENLIGHIVGKGGDRIKYLSSLYNNKRINIKKIAKIDVSKKISIKVF